VHGEAYHLGDDSNVIAKSVQVDIGGRDAVEIDSSLGVNASQQ
jgi:hypothetical protein